MTDDDPLEGADIGETVTVRETAEVWVDGLPKDDVADGGDRFVDTEVVDVEVRTNEYGEQRLYVTTESDVTKRLPRRWDTASAPRTDSERRAARRKKWVSRGITASVTGVTLGIGLVVTNYVMKRAAQGMTVNGEPLTHSPIDLVPVVLIVVVAFMAIQVWPFVARGAR